LKLELEGEAFRRAVAAVLPKHLTAERFVRVAILAMTRTPKLAQCDKASFFQALMQLSQFGLEPDGRRAHLIPFENRKRGVVECQLIIDWKGLAELAMRSGVVSNLHADVVRDGDKFDYSAGRIHSHVPWFLRRDAEKPRDAGEVFAVYAVAQFRDGSAKAEVMSIEDVESVRRRSKAANAGPWVTDYMEMAKKTVFRRLSKWLPLSPEFRDAVDADDRSDAIDTQVTPVGASIDFQIPSPAPEESNDAAPPDEIPGAEMHPESTPDAPKPSSPQEELALAVIEGGYSFDMFKSWCEQTGNVKGVDSMSTFEEIPTAVAERLLRAKKGLLTQLANIKATGRTIA